MTDEAGTSEQDDQKTAAKAPPRNLRKDYAEQVIEDERWDTGEGAGRD